MKNVHLLVCIHGLWGKPDHLGELARIIKAKYSPDPESMVELDVLVATSNAENWTYDGIDWGAERVAKEVKSYIQKLQTSGTQVTHFSIIGYSLGGLLARYIIGMFHSCGFFQEIAPRNFITIATPHVGLPKYPGFLSACFNAFSTRLLSRSGMQLSLRDKWFSSGHPLLEVMADKDQVFYQALSLFPHIKIYANAIKDVPVPYLTGAIELEDPFLSHEANSLQIHIDENYDPLLKSFRQRESLSLPPRPPLLSLAFLRTLKPTPLLIPVPVPLQLIIWLFLPVIFPMFLVFVVVRLFLASRASKARIRVLETSQAGGSMLVNTLHSLERRTEVAAADLITKPPAAELPKEYLRDLPSLTPLQQSMVMSLNALPQMRKHLAFIDGVLNSHAVIVCRDVEKVELHRRGEGILRHLVDNFVVH